MKKIWCWIKEATPWLFCVVGIIFGIVGLYKEFTRKNEIPSPPVEELRIDSIAKENNTLILEINSIDSIKDAQIIEVKTLDNDSTLSLFYQLIGK